MTSDGDGLRHRQASNASGDDSMPSASADYTPEQKDKVKKINSASNYYDMLGVPKTASEDDLRKGYKKRALQVHPDKNRAPGATEAFKALGNAVNVLTDKEKRRQYDLYGEVGPSQSYSSSNAQRTYYNFETEMSPDDIFNMFFSNQSGFQYTYARSRPQASRRRNAYESTRPRERQSMDGISMLFQLSPIIMMMVLSLLSVAMQGDDPYRFSKSEKFSHGLTTDKLGVKYFVQNGFSKVYHGNTLRKLEREIENVYVTNLRQECYKEQLHRENLRWAARYKNDGRAYENASNMKLHNCDKLQSLYT